MNADNNDATKTPLDPRTLSFSQAQGYEEIPGPLKLEELPKEARTSIWNVFYSYLEKSSHLEGIRSRIRYIDNPWRNILRLVHVFHDNRPIDEWSSKFHHVTSSLRHRIEKQAFHKVFDLIQFVMRHPECPSDFIKEMKQVFAHCRLAYVIEGEEPSEENRPPTILPAVTREEGGALLESLRTLDDAGLAGASSHLRKASERVNQGDWAGSVRESIHAVESVARTLAPDATTLDPALKSIEKSGALHPALKTAFSKLYGYASDEKGIRHALLNGDGADVGADEALFMLGACASFASYLWRKDRENADG